MIYDGLMPDWGIFDFPNVIAAEIGENTCNIVSTKPISQTNWSSQSCDRVYALGGVDSSLVNVASIELDRANQVTALSKSKVPTLAMNCWKKKKHTRFFISSLVTGYNLD